MTLGIYNNFGYRALVLCQVSSYTALELSPLPEAVMSIKGQNVNFKN